MTGGLQFAIRVVASGIIIAACAQIGRKFPSIAGLIAAMPSVTLLVLIWMYSDAPSDTPRLATYAKGVALGVFPTLLFFLAMLIAFRHRFSFFAALGLGTLVWIAAAAVHQWLMRKI